MFKREGWAGWINTVEQRCKLPFAKALMAGGSLKVTSSLQDEDMPLEDIHPPVLKSAG